MDIKAELSGMREIMFNDRLLDCLLTAYEQEMKAAHCTMIREDYIEGKTALKPFMSQEQLAELETIEALYRDNMKYAFEFVFFQGCHAFYVQLFSPGAVEQPFRQLVVEKIMTLPGMAEHQTYYIRQQTINSSFESMAAQLPRSCRESLTSVESFWDEQLYSVLRHSFYLGYLQAMGSAGAPDSSQASDTRRSMLSKLESELGFSSQR